MLINLLEIYLIVGLMFSIPEWISDVRCIIRSRKEHGFEGIIIEMFPFVDWIVIALRFLVITAFWSIIIIGYLIVDKAKKTD